MSSREEKWKRGGRQKEMRAGRQEVMREECEGTAGDAIDSRFPDWTLCRDTSGTALLLSSYHRTGIPQVPPADGRYYCARRRALRPNPVVAVCSTLPLQYLGTLSPSSSVYNMPY